MKLRDIKDGGIYYYVRSVALGLTSVGCGQALFLNKILIKNTKNGICYSYVVRDRCAGVLPSGGLICEPEYSKRFIFPTKTAALKQFDFLVKKEKETETKLFKKKLKILDEINSKLRSRLE